MLFLRDKIIKETESAQWNDPTEGIYIGEIVDLVIG